MRRPESSDGFLLCFGLNMLWEAGWGIAAVVLFILWLQTGLPSIWWRLALAAWLLIAFAKTSLIEWAGDVSSQRDPEKPNKNPYSIKTAKPPETEVQQAAPAPEEAQTPETQGDEIELRLQPAPAEVDLEKLNAALDGLKNQTGELTLEGAQGQTM